jgi:hypothetical protein
MQNLLVRKTDIQRIFPVIGPNFYSPNKSDEKSVYPGLRLIALAYPQLTWLQRYAGWRLAPDQQISRLVMFHRLAFEAELAAQFRRADFFWRETFGQLQSAWHRSDIWEAARTLLHCSVVTSAEAMRDCIAAELFTDTHIAFANGWLAGKATLDCDSRAFVHLGFIRTLLDMQELPPAEQALLLAPAVEVEIAALQKSKRWDDAISRVTQHLAMSPDDTLQQDRLALIHFRHAIDRLSVKGKELSDASWLDQKIEALERMRSANPDLTLAYNLLGQLYHLQSIRFANGGKLAHALVAARKAQVFAPMLDGVDETMSQLIDSMNQLQAQMRDIEKQLLASSNTSLNANGLRLQSEARQGFLPLEQYIKSKQPEQIAAARYRASACTLWRDIGLAATPRATDEKLVKLFEVVSELYGSETAETGDIAAAFRNAAISNPDIADLADSADRVAAFVVRRRRENAGGPKAEDEAVLTDFGPPETAEAFSIPVSAHVVRRKLEPLWYWLFGTQDRGYRVLAAVAGITAIAVVGISAADWWGSRVQSQAYQAIMAATGLDRESTVIAEAQRFIGARTLQANDPRKTQVLSLWRDALEAPNRRIRDTSFEQMRLALQRGDEAASLDAAERFLGAPPLQNPDPRQEKVLDAYAKTFVTWFANLAEPLGETAEARIQSYRKFASATPSAGKNQ